MQKRTGKHEQKSANETFPNLTNEVLQEIVVKPDGSIEIPWITPQATSLVLHIWESSTKEAFPITIITGNHIYCG